MNGAWNTHIQPKRQHYRRLNIALLNLFPIGIAGINLFASLGGLPEARH